MNSENSKTSKPYVLVLKLTNKLDLRIVLEDYCLIKSYHLLLVEKHNKFIQ